MDVMDFINRIEICCKEQGTTRTAWAKKIGFPESTIRNWIRNGNMPSVEIVYKFANYFGVTMEYLLNCPESEIDDTDFLSENMDIGDIDNIIEKSNSINAELALGAFLVSG